MNKFIFCGLFFVLASCASTQIESAKDQSESYGDKLGTVNFPVSCTEEASKHITRGVALLHHMTYAGSKQAFEMATAMDPECAMGYWGQATTSIHPLWSDKPTEEIFYIGKRLIDKASSRGNKTERETDYIKATQAYYAPGWTRDEKANLKGLEEGWQKVYQMYLDDSGEPLAGQGAGLSYPPSLAEWTEGYLDDPYLTLFTVQYLSEGSGSIEFQGYADLKRAVPMHVDAGARLTTSMTSSYDAP